MNQQATHQPACPSRCEDIFPDVSVADGITPARFPEIHFGHLFGSDRIPLSTQRCERQTPGAETPATPAE